jgi:hypothetical protein
MAKKITPKKKVVSKKKTTTTTKKKNPPKVTQASPCETSPQQKDCWVTRVLKTLGLR